MRVGERHLLTIQEPPLILEALSTLSTGAGQGDGEALRTLNRLEEFAKEGCGRLVLKLDAIDEPSGLTSPGVKTVDASLVGGVLVVTCQVTSSELGRIKLLTRRHSLPKQLISGVDDFISSTAARIRTALSRFGNPKPN
jgi:hypothetical protein